jgi:hypothetical protein
MLAGCQERFSDLAMQVIGNHDADSVDIVGVHDGLPAAFGTFEAVAISGVVSEVGVDVGNRHQTDRWRVGAEDRLGRAVGVCMGASGHAGADDGNPNGISHDDQPFFRPLAHAATSHQLLDLGLICRRYVVPTHR